MTKARTGVSGEQTDTSKINALKLLMSHMGLDAADVMEDQTKQREVPTFEQYIPVVAAAVTENTRRVYSTYWSYLERHWGSRRLNEPTPSEIKNLGEYVKAHVVRRRNSRGGVSALEHFLRAARCLYRHAEADGLIEETENAAAKVGMPRRPTPTRRALAAERLQEVIDVATTTGNDPALDALLLRLHTETACRRGGALALRPIDLDAQQCQILLQEKGATWRWQPVSRSLMDALQNHACQRGAVNEDQLLRYRNGKPITSRRYDYLFGRIKKHLPWAAAQQISIHWWRHTTLTWVERHHGYAVARRFAGHRDGEAVAGRVGSTATYVRADDGEVIKALVALTNEPHPCDS